MNVTVDLSISPCSSSGFPLTYFDALLLDAYKHFQDERYYKYAVNTLNCLLDNYQDESGALVTEICNHK